MFASAREEERVPVRAEGTMMAEGEREKREGGEGDESLTQL